MCFIACNCHDADMERLIKVWFCGIQALVFCTRIKPIYDTVCYNMIFHMMRQWRCTLGWSSWCQRNETCDKLLTRYIFLQVWCTSSFAMRPSAPYCPMRLRQWTRSAHSSCGRSPTFSPCSTWTGRIERSISWTRRRIYTTSWKTSSECFYFFNIPPVNIGWFLIQRASNSQSASKSLCHHVLFFTLSRTYLPKCVLKHFWLKQTQLRYY